MKTVLALMLCLALVRCSPHSPPKQARVPLPRMSTPAPTLGAITVQAQRNRTTPVSIVVVEHGRMAYRILADTNDSRRGSDGNYTSHFSQPVVTFFSLDGGRMRATARTADVDGATKSVQLHEAVDVLTADGSRLTCDHFLYDQRNQRIHGWGHVMMQTKQGDTLHGSDLTGNITLRSVHLDG